MNRRYKTNRLNSSNNAIVKRDLIRHTGDATARRLNESREAIVKETRFGARYSRFRGSSVRTGPFIVSAG